MDLEQLKFIVEIVVVLFITPLGAVLWFMLKNNAEHTQALAAAHSAHELYAAQTFATKVELQGSMQRVERGLETMYAKLERIDEKLDRKADK